jgi:hypothetical protein
MFAVRFLLLFRTNEEDFHEVELCQMGEALDAMNLMCRAVLLRQFREVYRAFARAAGSGEETVG